MRRAVFVAVGVGLALLAAGVADRAAMKLAGVEVGGSGLVAAPAVRLPLGDSIAPNGRDHADSVASYTLRATLDPVQHTLHGEGTIVWRNTSSEPQRELFVHLYLNAFKNDRTVFMRTAAPGFRGAALRSYGWIDVRRFYVREHDAEVRPEGATTPGDPEDETDIRVPLRAAVNPGESLTIDVEWEAKLPTITLRTGFEGSFHMVGQWYPKLARLEPDGRFAHFPFHRLSEFYADFGEYDVTIDVPEGFVVGATGQLIDEMRGDGRVALRFVQDDVHDFAFTAWDGFLEATAATDDGVSLRCLFPRGYERASAVELDAARFGLGYFGRAFGRYPYATLTIVHPPDGAIEAGGMEYPTLITTGGEWFLPYTPVHALEIVTLHELAHQWFYGLVATNEHAHPFLDEGLTSYAELSAMEALFPDASAAGPVLGLSVGLPAVYRAAAIEARRDAPVAQGAAEFVTGYEYGALVYARTATILRTLGNVYGEDVMLGAIGRYARRHRFGHPGPDDLLVAVREAVSEEAAEALRSALFERGSVDFVVDRMESGRAAAPRGIFGPPGSPREASPAVSGDSGYRGEAIVRRLGELVLPVDVDFYGEDGQVTRVRWDAKESVARIPYTGAAGLAAVVIDPEHRVLLDEDLSNNARRSGREVIGRRVLGRAVLAAEIGLLIASP